MLRAAWGARLCRWASAGGAATPTAQDLPPWLRTLLDDVGGSLGAAEPYRFMGWPGTLKADVKERLAKGDPQRTYHRLHLSGDALNAGGGFRDGFCFQSPLDNPFESCPEHPPAVWWDGVDPGQGGRIWVQLGPQFPPLFWIPIKGNAAALQRLFEEYQDNDDRFLADNIPEYEAYLERGAALLAPLAEEDVEEPAPALEPGRPATPLLAAGASGRLGAHGARPLPFAASNAVGGVQLLEGSAAGTATATRDAINTAASFARDDGDGPAAGPVVDESAVDACVGDTGAGTDAAASAADAHADSPLASSTDPADTSPATEHHQRTLSQLTELLGAYDDLLAPAPAVASAGGNGAMAATAGGSASAGLLPRASHAYETESLVPWAERGETGDLYRRAAGTTEALNIKKEHSEQHWYYLGTTISPEDVEAKMMANPFLFGRWPAAVVGGEQRLAATGDKKNARVYCSVFRSVYSKSKITFTTREDEPHATVNVEGDEYKELSGLYCCVDHPSSMRMSGGRSVVEWYNREFGCDFPLTTPVDVVGALALFRPKAVSQVAAEYSVAGGRMLDNTKDVVRELARRQRASLTPKEREYVASLDTLSAEANAAVADDASHPAVLQLTQYLRRLAIMKYPDFEDKCFRPFWNHNSKYVRVKVHEACVLAGRADLAQIMLSRESDPWVVGQICDVAGQEVADPHGV